MRRSAIGRTLCRMEETKFPVPEGEAHKLDEVVQSLQQQPFLRKIDDSVRSQPWAFVIGAFAIGLLWSVGCAGRDH